MRYKESENLDRLKMEFANQNELPDIDELAEDNNAFKEKTEEYMRLHNEAAQKLPYYKMIRKMSMDPALGDEVAENTLDAIAKFNIDMKVLALNAYQLQDLLELSIQENELMINWLSYLENKTIKNEEKLYKIIDKAEKTVKKKAKLVGLKK